MMPAPPLAPPGAAPPPSFHVGPFAVDRDGGLQPRPGGQPPAMRFAWRGRRCEAALGPAGLSLAAVAGRVPSTADRGADRSQAFRTLAGLPRDLPPEWRLRLLPDHRILLETAMPMAPATTATGLVAAMVRFVLALDPYLDRLDADCGLSPEGCSPSGT